MDSFHSSPISVRVVTTHANEAPDYDSSVDCCSVCEDREDLSSLMDITPTRAQTPLSDNINDNCDHNMDNECNNYLNYRNNLNLSSDRNVIKTIDATLSPKLIVNQTSVQTSDPKFFMDSKPTTNLSDAESQNRELRRKKSLIYRLYSNGGLRRRNRLPARLSILGRPIHPHRMRNEISFYKEKIAVYNFLSRPQGLIAVGYHIFVSFVVFICLLLTIFSTISDYESSATNGLKYTDSFIAAMFSSEFLARLWSSSCISHYQGWRGKLRFLRNPFRLIDMFVIITSCIVLFFDTKRHTLFVYFRGFRFFQVFQMLRLEHRFRPWRLMASVVWAQREHLAITTYMGFLSLLLISFLIYFVEKDVNPAFSSIAASMWWGVITLCTVGYGDMSPVTPIGKFLSCICIIVGVSIFALPAGILGTGLALKVQEQQRHRHLGKRREPAAKLIQCTWRCYAAREDSISKVTWKAHIRPNSKVDVLTSDEKTAIRFLRIVKYFIARRTFNTALKPYDIKDVLEQYAAGHAEVLGRVKHMQSRLNAVQSSVGNNQKTLQESKSMLSSRMTQIEFVVNGLQNKFEDLIAVQLRDQKIIETLAIILSQQNNCDIKRKLLLPSSPTSVTTRRMSF